MMSRALGWRDTEDIAILLHERKPDVNPLSVRFTDLHAMILELPGFTGDPKASSEGILESIQMAWLEEFNDAN